MRSGYHDSQGSQVEGARVRHFQVCEPQRLKVPAADGGETTTLPLRLCSICAPGGLEDPWPHRWSWIPVTQVNGSAANLLQGKHPQPKAMFVQLSGHRVGQRSWYVE